MKRSMKRALIVAGLAAAAVAALVLVQAAPYLLSSQRDEAARLFALMEINAGDVVAEIGAGKGLMTVEAARRVGPTGRVYSTELSAERREDIRAAAAAERHANVTVVAAEPAATALPASCCDAIFMRHVYHHIEDRPAFTASLRRSVKEGGLVAIIDFERGSFWHLTGSHGASLADIVGTMRGAGFDEVQRVEGWKGRSFLVLFRAR